jgi:hypothetical protein
MTENHKNTPQSEGESPQDTININDNTKVNNLNYYVSLFPECREDLKMWHIFLKQWNRVSFFYDTLTTSSDDLVLLIYNVNRRFIVTVKNYSFFYPIFTPKHCRNDNRVQFSESHRHFLLHYSVNSLG